MTSCGHTLMTTLHFVLAYCNPPRLMFLTFALLLTAEASVGDACGGGCGAAAAFRKEKHTIFASFIFLCSEILSLC